MTLLKTEKKQEAKEKAASKIVKKMGDKGRYDDNNQLKTLVVMQVLGNTKTFFDNQTQLQDTAGLFDNRPVPDTTISDNIVSDVGGGIELNASNGIIENC